MPSNDAANSSNHGGHGGPPSLKSWILAARPKTLPAALVPVWVGSVLTVFGCAEPHGCFHWNLFLSTLASCFCIQIATNLFNDAIDHDKGADTENRLGPVRATAAGLLSRRTVYLGAMGFCLLAAVIAIPLIQARGGPIIAIGTVSLLLAFAYTGGPFPLAYRGMGEIFVVLFFGLIAVGGSYFVQTGFVPGGLVLLAGLQVGLYSSVLIAINNLRDVEEDTQSGKVTLAVRFGKTFARWEIAFFCWAPLAMTPLWKNLIKWPFWALPWLLAPLAILITVKIFRTEPGRIYNRYLALSALQLLLYGILFTIPFMEIIFGQ